MVEIITAVAWPVGIILILCIAPFSIRSIVKALKESNLRVKGPGGFEAVIERGQTSEGGMAEPSTAAPRLSDESKSVALTVVESGDETLPKSRDLEEHFYFVKDGETLASRFSAFKESDDAYKADPDFWESIYVERRREVGVGGSDDELQRLIDEHPEWIWPKIFLARRKTDLGAYEQAESLLSDLIERHGFESGSQPYSEAVKLYFRWQGVGRAMEFVRDSVTKGASSDLTAELLNDVASLNDDKQNPFTHVFLREVALRYTPGSRSNRFDVAYAYGEHPSFSSLACHHYHQIIDRDPTHTHTKNNLSIIYGNFGEPLVKNDYMNDAAEHGELLAKANHARNLASAGFVANAELIVSSADWSEDEEQKARVESFTKEKRKEIPEIITRIRKETDKDFVELQRAIGLVAKAWLDDGEDWYPGTFDTTVGQGVIVVDVSAKVEITLGGKRYVGTLQRQPLCAGGWLSEVGGSLLGADRRQAALLMRSAQAGSLLVWPSAATPSGLISIDVKASGS